MWQLWLVTATGSNDGTIKLWSLPECLHEVTCLATLNGHTDAVNSVIFHPTSPFALVSTSMDNIVRFWRLSRNFSSATPIANLEIDGDPICAAFDPRTNTLVTGTKKNKLKLVN